jgi:hypothetical protein
MHIFPRRKPCLPRDALRLHRLYWRDRGARPPVIHISRASSPGCEVMHSGCIGWGYQSHQLRMGSGGSGASTSSPFIALTILANREKRMPDRIPFSSREMTDWWTPDARCRSRCDQRIAVRRRFTVAPRRSKPRWTSGNPTFAILRCPSHGRTVATTARLPAFDGFTSTYRRLMQSECITRRWALPGREICIRVGGKARVGGNARRPGRVARPRRAPALLQDGVRP